MSVEIRVPTLGESVTEGILAKWLKKAGDAVAGRRAAVRAGDRQGQPRGARPGGRRAGRDPWPRGTTSPSAR